jgi:hypothetical protein
MSSHWRMCRLVLKKTEPRESLMQSFITSIDNDELIPCEQVEFLFDMFVKPKISFEKIQIFRVIASIMSFERSLIDLVSPSSKNKTKNREERKETAAATTRNHPDESSRLLLFVAFLSLSLSLCRCVFC